MRKFTFAATLAATAALLAGAAQAQITETPEIAAQIAGMGTELTREVVGGTMALYAPLHEGDDTGLTVTRDQSYGPHERNVLDVYAPDGADGTQPVVIYVHGGGFVRGDKSEVDNIPRWFAQNGVVGIAMNYRFAPDNLWPAGAEDLAMALDWIRQNPDIHGGDPAKIVVAGNSAGAMHVADYTFREELQAENDGVIGAILISPPTVDLNAREVDPTRDALYYGTDGDRSAQSVVNAVEGREIPVLVAFAEYEPDVILDQTRLLIEALAQRDGRMPLVASAPGHNHISIVEHIGTADETLAPDLLEFVRLVTMRSE